MNEKQMKILGWVATFMSVMMYVSYFPQIMDNLAGHKGNFVQPLVAAINCSLWVTHFHGIMGGLFIEKIKRRQEWIKNITVKSYGRKINTWC